MKKHLVILVLFSLIALWPFFNKGFYQSHDGEWMIIRFTAFHQTLRAGQFPVRFVDRLNNNYGYPVLNFLYPLPFYLSEIPKLAGLGFIQSIKFTFVISTILSVVFMYFALKELFERESAFVGAFLYLFSPYRFLDIYVRGSIGENLAFTFLPLILYFVLKIGKGKKFMLPLLSLSIGALILSHNVIALLFLPVILFSTLFFGRKNKIQIFIFTILGITIASFFWIPALFDLQYVRLSQIKVSNVSDHLVNFSKLLIPSWGFGSNPNDTNGLSPQLGIVAISVLISSVFLEIKTKHKNKAIVFFIGISMLIIIFLSKASTVFWTKIPGVDIIQFPWRLLSIFIFSIAILSSYLIHTQKNMKLLAVIITAAAFLSTIVYTLPKNFSNFPDSYYSTNESTTTVADEYMPLWAGQKNPSRAQTKIQATASGVISNLKILPANYKAKIRLNEDSEITVNSIYFPGWQIKSDNKKIPISHSGPYGLIKFSLPKGDHEVIINYTRTPVHALSEVLSLIAAIATGLSFFILWQKRNS